MIKSVYRLCICMLLSFISCGESRVLREAESLLETDPAAADSVLSSIQEFSSNRDRALYAVLKTQADYKLKKTITSDSLIKTATNHFGTSIRGTKTRRYHSALAWYSQGSVYTELKNDFAAIDAYLKAKDMFPDTLVRYYALTENYLGTHYLNRMMLEEAKQVFTSCKNNADRLQDVKMSNYAYFHIGLSALYSRDFLLADSIFREIINNDVFSISQQTDAFMELAKIRLHYNKNYNEALYLIETYNRLQKKPEFHSSGLSIKADIYYEMRDYDSALYFYSESMKFCNDLYTECSNADRLAELSQIKGDQEMSVFWHKLYGNLRDSINKVERSREIEDLQYKHRDIITGAKYAYRHRIIMTSVLFVLLLSALTLYLIYSTFKHRESEKIMLIQQKLQKEEEEIRKTTIGLLESKIRDFSDQDPDARSVLFKSYSNRLKMCTRNFKLTPDYKLVSTIKINIKNLKKEDKQILFSNIKQSYLESITDIQREIPNINENEILTILFRHLNLSIEQISDLFSITTDSVKKRLYRLSQKSSSDFLKLYGV